MNKILNILAILFVILGIAISTYFFVVLSQGGTYEPAKLELWEFCVAIISGFLHFFIAALCYGVSIAINNDNKERIRLLMSKILKFFGLTILLISIIAPVIVYVYAGLRSNMLLKTTSSFIYTFVFGAISLGMYKLLLRYRIGENK